MATTTKRTKRDSTQVDKLVAEVDKLHNNGMSINAACKKVGIQNTVYYFRKRKDEALSKAGVAPDSNPKRDYHFQKRKEELLSASKRSSTSSGEMHEHKDIDELKQEYRDLENRLNSIKLAIADKVMSKSIEKR